jgi:hypothetical protein
MADVILAQIASDDLGWVRMALDFGAAGQRLSERIRGRTAIEFEAIRGLTEASRTLTQGRQGRKGRKGNAISNFVVWNCLEWCGMVRIGLERSGRRGRARGRGRRRGRGQMEPNVSSPRRGGFKVQQVQQIHKRPCLQEVSELLKVQQKCNMKCNKVQRRRKEVFRVQCSVFRGNRGGAATRRRCKLKVAGCRF